MKACIIANGNINNYNYFSKVIKTADLIICADGGASHLKKMNILPHIIIGDLDSMESKELSFYKKKNIKIIKYQSDKDATDSELAIDFAIEQNCNDITLIAACGTRLDHTLANIFLLKKICELKANARIIDDHNEIFLVKDKITLKKDENSFVSMIPLTDTVEGVTTSGLKYPLTDEKIRSGTSLGISNEFIDNQAIITVKKGLLIVTKSKD